MNGPDRSSAPEGSVPGTAGVPAVKDTGLVPLAQAHRLPDANDSVAGRLGQLIATGFNVVEGFVITDSLARRLVHGPLEANREGARPLLDAAGAARLDALWSALGVDRVSVRSSATHEHAMRASFAGVHRSMSSVTRDELSAAAGAVHGSLDSPLTQWYLQRGGEPAPTVNSLRGDVLVQAEVPAQFTGALFTEHPHSAGVMLVEMSAGDGDDAIDTFCPGKLSGVLPRSGEDSAPPIDLAQLLAIGRGAEALFARPQHIEWRYADGRFLILQTRDICRPITAGDSLEALAERERARALDELSGRRRRPRQHDTETLEAPLLVRTDVAGRAPRATPMSIDLMQRLENAGGSMDLACRQLGMAYEVHPRSVPCTTTLFGWTYTNLPEQARRRGGTPGALATLRLTRDAEAMKRAFLDDFLPHFQLHAAEREDAALEKLSLENAVAVLDAWVTRFIESTWVQVKRLQVAAEVHERDAAQALQAAGFDAPGHLQTGRDFLAARALALLDGERLDPSTIDEFLTLFGHRAPDDFELRSPRFEEDPSLIEHYRSRPVDGSRVLTDVGQLDTERSSPAFPHDALEQARTFHGLHEDARHHCLIELAQIRRLLMTIDRAAGLEGRIFQLTLDEVSTLHESGALPRLSALADERATDALIQDKVQPPTSLSLDALERMDLVTGNVRELAGRGAGAGMRVSGTTDVTGVARVITRADQIDAFCQGEILVARSTDASWYHLYPDAAGIVTETGGWSSDAAIVAREFELPMIARLASACSDIQTGDVITLGAHGSVVQQQQRRRPVASAPNPAPAPTLEQSAAGGNVHPLNEHRRFRLSGGLERRSVKAQRADRRAVPRFDANGEPVPDRRAISPTANLDVYRSG